MTNRLVAELHRLYFLADQRCVDPAPDGNEAIATKEQLARMLAGETTLALAPVATGGMARAMVVRFEYAADWTRVAALYQAVIDDLELPAPAVSVSGRSGFCLWFSLADPVAGDRLREFLGALRRKYLHDVPAGHVRAYPEAAEAHAGANLAPALCQTTGKWSAFIDPEMGGMFVDEPGLGMAPNMDRQADLLAGLTSIDAAALATALRILQAPYKAAAVPTEAKANPEVLFPNPKDFLLAVMNDPSAGTDQRIEAAKALLPYFESLPLK